MVATERRSAFLMCRVDATKEQRGGGHLCAMADLLLPAFYFGSVEHYALIARSRRVVIDTGEHYERQSYRTRTGIIGPNGRKDLIVTIDRRSGEKMPMRTVGLSYAEPWNARHVQAIRSAYV